MAPNFLKKSDKKKRKTLPSALENELKQGVPIDRGYSWAMVVASFFIYMFFASNMRSLGILSVEFTREYNCTKGDTSLMLSLIMCSFLFVSPVSSWLGSQPDCRIFMLAGSVLMTAAHTLTYFVAFSKGLLIVFSIILGFGLSLSHIVCLAFINTYFFNRRGLANGIMFAGASTGAFFGPPILIYLLGVYGIKGAQLIFGGILFHGCICSVLMRPKSFFIREYSHNQMTLEMKNVKLSYLIDDQTDAELEIKENCNPIDECFTLSNKDDDENNLSIIDHNNKTIADCNSLSDEFEHKRCNWCMKNKIFGPFLILLKNPWFWLYCVATSLAMMGMPLSFYFVAEYGEEIKLTRGETTLILFIQGFPDVFFRLLSGWLLDMFRINRAYLTAGVFFGQAMTYLVPTLFPSFGGILTFAILQACFGGSGMPAIIALAAEVVDHNHLPPLLGLNLLIQGVFYMVILKIFGSLRDAQGTWISSFYIMVSLSMLASFLFGILSFYIRRRRKRQLTLNLHNNFVSK